MLNDKIIANCCLNRYVTFISSNLSGPRGCEELVIGLVNRQEGRKLTLLNGVAGLDLSMKEMKPQPMRTELPQTI